MPDYTYHPDLARYAHMKSTLSPWFVRLSHGPMKLLYAAQQSGGGARVSRLSVPRSDGSCLRMLLYAPAGCEGETPCVYFLHGGGFVFNAAPHHFALAGELARALGVRVALPDYRLAPRHTFPAAHEDALTGYRWLWENAAALRIDPARIAAAGDSAGGNLAAVLCLMAREQRLPMPCAQMLLYPVLDARMETESYRQFTDTPMCSSRDMEKYFVPCTRPIRPPRRANGSPRRRARRCRVCRARILRRRSLTACATRVSSMPRISRARACRASITR